MSPLKGIALLLFSIDSMGKNLHAIWHFVCEPSHTLEALLVNSAHFQSSSLKFAQFSSVLCTVRRDTSGFRSRTPVDHVLRAAYPAHAESSHSAPFQVQVSPASALWVPGKLPNPWVRANRVEESVAIGFRRLGTGLASLESRPIARAPCPDIAGQGCCTHLDPHGFETSGW